VWHAVDIAGADHPIIELSFTAYAISGPNPQSSSSGLGLVQEGVGGYAAWQADAFGISCAPGSWQFYARPPGDSSSLPFCVLGGFNQPVELGVVLDRDAGEVYGRYDFGSGVVETPHFPMSAAQIDLYDMIVVTNDWRGIATGVEIDNILVVAEPDMVPEPRTIAIWLVLAFVSAHLWRTRANAGRSSQVIT
jgi:hypothetical protein